MNVLKNLSALCKAGVSCRSLVRTLMSSTPPCLTKSIPTSTTAPITCPECPEGPPGYIIFVLAVLLAFAIATATFCGLQFFRLRRQLARDTAPTDNLSLD